MVLQVDTSFPRVIRVSNSIRVDRVGWAVRAFGGVASNLLCHVICFDAMGRGDGGRGGGGGDRLSSCLHDSIRPPFKCSRS